MILYRTLHQHIMCANVLCIMKVLLYLKGSIDSMSNIVCFLFFNRLFLLKWLAPLQGFGQIWKGTLLIVVVCWSFYS